MDAKSREQFHHILNIINTLIDSAGTVEDYRECIDSIEATVDAALDADGWK